MKFQKVLILFFLFVFSFLNAQQDPLSIYRGERERINNLVHTKLKVDFDFKNRQLNGEEWVTLTPHFYPTSKVTLDAKAMLIHSIELGGRKLDYHYDDYQIIIDLPREYKKGEEYTLYIKYTARPEKVKQKGSSAITSAKGLYFINPLGLEEDKPIQVWTQGETEASSCWFPTIDAPNQKTSQELYITVPDKFVTLSNGELVNQEKTGSNRTDYWKLDQKHAPYLFFMGVGEYEIIKDTYKNIPVNYYVEKKYAPYAKDIFGHTPEMIGFFAEKLGVEYPWNKYSQIVARDYVSGAMENTTAVIHGEQANQMKGQLIDENKQENTIAHEVFHHWFGNLVTTESWSNLTLNESFANYSEYLWREYKYGKDDADAHLFEDVKAYKDGQNFDKDLVRFYYADKEDMFDAVSYNKGGAILHMLRRYLGDEAFFTGLKKYLNDYKYKAAEAHQLRLTLEEVSGKDLNWFFNQWYFGSGHPKIQVSYDYNTLEKTVTVNFIQSQQNEFKFPIAIDIFENGSRTRYNVFVDGRDASYKFSFSSKSPDLIQVNADGVLLADFIENKVLSDYIFQLKNAVSYEHRREALLEVVKKQDDKKAFNAVVSALDDSFYKIRILALENIDLINKWSKKNVIDKIQRIASNDKKTLVRAAAIETLGKLTDPELRPVFEKALQSESYNVLGKALVGMYYIDKDYAIKKSKELPLEVKNIIATPLTRIYIEEKDESEMVFIANNVLSGMFLNNNPKIQAIYQKAYEQIATSNNTEAIRNLVKDVVAKGNQYKQFNFDKVGINLLRQMVQKQNKANKPNKFKNIEVIKTGIAQLVQ
ncbi:M1 family metallopeptidase [Pseudotenacibaculum sp. MALMAid0570]|uniref:M1 family metallopeptidase n=1 Tax=Pseudotenacibaculum sp. MALMAid0570 TaxID=3143938 RepID=UPI0032DE8A88